VAYLTQTTLSVDDAEIIIAALRRRFPQIVGPSKDDICLRHAESAGGGQGTGAEADLVLVLAVKTVPTACAWRNWRRRAASRLT